MSSLSFRSHGFTLAGNLFIAEHPKPLAFLFIQGWRGEQNIGAARALSELGYSCMTYDMRGNGESEGDITLFSRDDFTRDAVVAYDYLQNIVGPSANIDIVSESFGAYTAALLSQEREVACMSLHVPASYPDEGYHKPAAPQIESSERKTELRNWRSTPLTHTQNRAYAALHAFNGPVQIIEAELDETVHRQSPLNYAAAVQNKEQLVYQIEKGAPHSLVDDKLQAEYEKQLTEWVLSSINPLLN